MIHLFRKKYLVKPLLVLTLIHFLGGLFYPTVSWALTTGPTQPEVYGNQPADATDNVNLVTGGFNYTLPITSVPEYPMAIGYNSGIGMDQEASCFGLGFNGFSGAIGRNVIGVPDDSRGQQRVYEFSNETNWDVSFTATGQNQSKDVGSNGQKRMYSISSEVNTTMGYNNMAGAYGSVGLSLDVSVNIEEVITLGVNFAATDDSRYGTSESIGFSAALIFGCLGYNVTKSLNSGRVEQQVTVFNSPIYDQVDGEYPTPPILSNTMLFPSASVSPNSRGFGIRGYSAAYSQFQFLDGAIRKNLIGYAYHNQYNREDSYHLPDFTVEGEDSYNDDDRNNPSYLQKDNFEVNCQGLNGTMQLVGNEHGVFSRNYSRNQEREESFYIKTQRKETFPWDRVRSASFDESTDMLKLFKKPKGDNEKDFDSYIFYEVDEGRIFPKVGDFPILRFKGDLAGEMNMSSDSYKDYQPNQYEAYQVTGDGTRGYYFGAENQAPMYSVREASYDSYTRPAIQRSSKIDYGTDGDGFINKITVTRPDGTVYVFGDAVYAGPMESVLLSGKGKSAPYNATSEYRSDEHHNNRRLKTTDSYRHPYAWLLTEIRGVDYVDFNTDNTTGDGDLGYWVRFTYTDAQSYNWREPFIGMNHNMVEYHSPQTDVYAAQKGTRDVKYLRSIESSGYICRYNYTDRNDGYGSSGDLVSGDAKNTRYENELLPDALNNHLTNSGRSTSNPIKRCESIDLFTKHPSGSQSASVPADVKTDALGSFTVYGKKIRSTLFDYSYELCPKTFNNSHYTSGGDESGKLTLTKVQHIAYSYDANGSITPSALPSYKMEYAHTTYQSLHPENPNYYNPNYDRRQVDMWGNYSSGAKLTSNGVSYYHDDEELLKSIADDNAKTFQLTKIYFPTGGSMQVDYEAGGYATVQDQTPLAMRRLRVDNSDPNKYYVDVTDLDPSEYEKYFPMNGGTYKAQIAYFLDSHPAPDPDMFLARAPITASNTQQTRNDFGDGRTYLTLETGDCEGNPDCNNKTYYDLYVHILEESPRMRAVKDGLTGCPKEDDVSKFQGYEQTNRWDALKNIVGYVKNYFTTKEEDVNQYESCYGTIGVKNFPHYSFLLTNVKKEKYTGHRVKSVTYRDAFNYSSNTTPNGQDLYGGMPNDNVYTTNYFYDENGDGTGKSSGVATIEPNGGISCVVDMVHTKGIGFMPSPSILYSKVTVENGYQKALRDHKNDADVVSREKGKIAYEFITAKDVLFRTHFIPGASQATTANGHFFIAPLRTWLILARFNIGRRHFEPKVAIIVPVVVNWWRTDYYHVSSYAYVDESDKLGKLKSVTQLSASGDWTGKQEYFYTDMNSTSPVYSKDNKFDGLPTNTKPGRFDQAWSEAYYTKESDILLNWMFLRAETKRHFSYTNMKYTYVPSLLEKVVNTSAESYVTTTEYGGFDYLSGEAIQVKTNDSYNNQKISRKEPAYWYYSDMEAKNRLGETAGSYVYLNDATSDKNKNLLSAAVTQWGNTGFNYVPSLVISNVQSDPVSGRNYSYDLVDANTLSLAFTNPKVNMYRPVATYVYKSDIDANGTFTKGNFDFLATTPPTDANWKLVSQNTLYSADGTLVETKDILGKYAATYLGYNFSHNVATVSNSTYNGSAFEGAENTYIGSDGSIYLDNLRVTPGSASVVSKDCQRFVDRVLNYNHLVSTAATKLTICSSVAIQANKPLAKVDVTFDNQISRTYSIRVDEQNQVRMLSNLGESFTGFYLERPNKKTCQLNYDQYDLYLDPSVVTIKNVTPLAGPNYSITSSTAQPVISCAVDDKPYQIPNDNCMGEVHTGNYAFSLPTGNSAIGTQFKLNYAEVPPQEYKRKYMASVWVHTSSPSQTQLTIRAGANYSQTVDMSAPYVTAGNWKQLRAEIDLSASTGTDPILAYVQNLSSNGTAYYDDFRVQPSTATMEANVYDAIFGRMMAKLNAENLATYYEYDARGRLVKTKVELQGLGPVIVKKSLYNDQKKD
jgi:hypothetical protein